MRATSSAVSLEVFERPGASDRPSSARARNVTQRALRICCFPSQEGIDMAASIASPVSVVSVNSVSLPPKASCFC
jgi:hypothetical protein